MLMILHVWFLCLYSMQAIQNLGLAVVAIAAGKIVDEKGYLVVLVFFLAWLCCKSYAV